ncbi:MAG: hypothetical protein HQM16_17790 [Deltaproteobacteria bacterium]|nr:hypothetical protein [Deltaproteobacteria bacterium]
MLNETRTVLTLPESFTRILLKYLKTRYLNKKNISPRWDDRDTDYFARGILELNRGFTGNRAGRYFDYFSNPVMRSGYLAYFLPVNAMKFAGIFAKHDPDTKPGEIFIADIGAGPLTASLGFLFSLSRFERADDLIQNRITGITIDAYELNRSILNDGINLVYEYIKEAGLEKKIKIKINPVTGNIFRKKMPNPHKVENTTRADTMQKLMPKRVEKTFQGSKKRYDYILMGNFLNEFAMRDVQTGLVMNILKNHSFQGTKVLMLEPGSKKIARDLQFIRDEVVCNTQHRVLAPCLHQLSCPLNLTAKSDWCNFTQRWQAPEFIRAFDAVTNLKKMYLLYSYLFLINDKNFTAPKRPRDFIAISDPMSEKGRLSLVGCGASGRIRFIRSNRDTSPQNDKLALLHRGDYFSVPDLTPPDCFELNMNVGIKKGDRVT